MRGCKACSIYETSPTVLLGRSMILLVVVVCATLVTAESEKVQFPDKCDGQNQKTLAICTHCSTSNLHISRQECCADNDLLNKCTEYQKESAHVLAKRSGDYDQNEGRFWKRSLDEGDPKSFWKRDQSFWKRDVTEDMDDKRGSKFFLGKRPNSKYFLGKRAKYFLGKRSKYFLGKRDDESDEFMADFDSDDMEKRVAPMSNEEMIQQYREFMENQREAVKKSLKRRIKPFLGKRGQGNMKYYLGKRYNVKPFLGKRSVTE